MLVDILYIQLLKKATLTFDKVVDYLESSMFKEFSKYSKMFSPHPIMQSLLSLIAYSLGKLKYVAVSIED